MDLAEGTYERDHGGTHGAREHADCGHRANMHAGCLWCCDCPDCGFYRAAVYRADELQHELASMGARVIRVRDLGAALEARERGGIAIQVVTGPGWQPMPFAPTIAIRAAHLARVALGESS